MIVFNLSEVPVNLSEVPVAVCCQVHQYTSMQNHNREGNVLCHAINENRFIALRVDLCCQKAAIWSTARTEGIVSDRIEASFAVRFQVVCSERMLTPYK